MHGNFFKIENCLYRIRNRCHKTSKVKLRFNRLTSQNCKSIKRFILKIILELLKRSKKCYIFYNFFLLFALDYIVEKSYTKIKSKIKAKNLTCTVSVTVKNSRILKYKNLKIYRTLP